MTSSFPLLTLEQTSKNPNSQYGLSLMLQFSMANGNTQFAIDISKQLKISYSIPTIALQIASRFFHLRCYINYQRFMIILSCMILAFKMKYMEFKFKDVIYGFYRIMCFRCGNNDPFDQKMLNRIKDQICVAQNQVLRTLQYQIDVVNPHDYLPKILQISLSSIQPSKLQKIKQTTRILILDSNRVQASLYFSPLVIAISCFMISCRYQNIKPYMMTNSTGTSTSQADRSQQNLYQLWIDSIAKQAGQGEKVKQQDILNCVKHVNKIFELLTDH